MNLESWMFPVVALAIVMLLPRLLGGGRAKPDVVKAMIANGAQIVDVRSPEEFRGGAFKGARNIPLPNLGQRLGELQKDKPLVVYCASGMRSAAAAGQLKKAGFSNVANAGGLAQMPR